MNPQQAIPQSSTFDQFSTLDFERGQILNLNKPVGWSSFDVVKRVRHLTGVRKVGHAGTLDPFATGVLLVCTGRATKKVSGLMDLEKEYKAELEFGKATDTHDPTGTFLPEKSTSSLSLPQIEAVCEAFEGEILQTPPMYSAVKVKGQRLYKMARRGQTIDRPSRKVVIKRIELLKFEHPRLWLNVTCSKGTYIRALAHDMGERLGCGAYLRSLVRTRIGSYSIENACAVMSGKE